jgi:hypothetical protein
VAVGAGNIKPTNGGQIVGVGAGGFQIKDHLGNVVAVGAGNVKNSSGQVVAVGAGNVVAVGAGNLQIGLGQVVAVGAGNLAPSSFTQSIPMPGPGKLTEAITMNPANLISDAGSTLISDGGGSFLHNRIVAAGKRKLPKKVVLATAQASRTDAGVAVVRVKFTKAGKQLLAAIRKDRKRKKGKHLKALRFSTSLTYTAKGGKPIVVTRSGRAAPRH